MVPSEYATPFHRFNRPRYPSLACGCTPFLRFISQLCPKVILLDHRLANALLPGPVKDIIATRTFLIIILIVQNDSICRTHEISLAIAHHSCISSWYDGRRYAESDYTCTKENLLPSLSCLLALRRHSLPPLRASLTAHERMVRRLSAKSERDTETAPALQHDAKIRLVSRYHSRYIHPSSPFTPLPRRRQLPTSSSAQPRNRPADLG